MNKFKFLPLFFIYLFSLYLAAEDIRTLSINADMKTLSDRGFVNFKCKYSNKVITSWLDYEKCMLSKDDVYYIKVEYDEKFAFNENFEGTQVAGHPVLMHLGIDKKGLLKVIDITTDPSAPFYFRKQAHLMWLRIHGKYGSDGWSCKNFDKKDDHIVIGKKYINRLCEKRVDNVKTVSIGTKFFFKNNKKDKENLVSVTNLKIFRNKM